jgi:two-component system CheB/CheR fusion protein
MAGENPADFEHVLSALPERKRLVVIAHCTGGRLSSPVEYVKSPAKIEPGRIYAVPPEEYVEIRDRALVPTPKPEALSTADVLMRDVADAFGARTIGVILSGAAGALGIKRIKEVGGITMASAGAIGNDNAIDLVLPPAEIAARLVRIDTHSECDDGPPDPCTDTLRDILALVRDTSGHDFSPYKRATLFRRISRRMLLRQQSSIAAYHRDLCEQPEELQHLVRDFLISITSFFRDPDAFDALAKAIPSLFANKQPNEQVRVWVPGCASGEEAYSLAMLLTEYAQQVRAPQPIQVFATDIDEASLAEARIAQYPETIGVDLDATRLRHFFTREHGYYRVRQDIRDQVIFSPNDLLRAPPFSRLDLISCRNLLVYLNREAQDRVLNLFHFGLRPGGCLFLGASESAANASLFSVLDSKHRIYGRAPSTHVRMLGIEVPATPPRHADPRLTIEQYESALEELRAANEDLQTRLCAVTDELAATKQELQSAHQELTALADERDRS